MKMTLSIVFIVLTNLIANAQNKLNFEATFAEGYGKYIQKSLRITKIYYPKNTKLEDRFELFAIVNDGKKITQLQLECDKKITESLVNMIGAKDSLLVTVVGYESIKISGGPSLTESVSQHNIPVPATTDWRASSIFVIYSIVSEK